MRYVRRKLKDGTYSVRKKPTTVKDEGFEEYDEERLLSYAGWYSGKYNPSMAKLKSKLVLKSRDSDAVERVLSKMAVFVNEDYMIRSAIEGALATGKSKAKIKEKLFLKRYDADKVSEILSEYSDAFEDNEAVFSVVDSFVKKGLNYEKTCQRLSMRGFNPFKGKLREYVKSKFGTERYEED